MKSSHNNENVVAQELFDLPCKVYIYKQIKYREITFMENLYLFNQIFEKEI